MSYVGTAEYERDVAAFLDKHGADKCPPCTFTVNAWEGQALSSPERKARDRRIARRQFRFAGADRKISKPVNPPPKPKAKPRERVSVTRARERRARVLKALLAGERHQDIRAREGMTVDQFQWAVKRLKEAGHVIPPGRRGPRPGFKRK